MVADTFSSTLGVLLMGAGNDNNTWGNNVNVSDFQIFEDAIANIFSSVATSGTVDLSASPPPAGPSQARFWHLFFGGSLTGNLTVKVPNLSKEWFINNGCTLNGFSLQIQTPSGSPVTIPPGWNRVFCNGVNFIGIWPQGQLQNQMPGGSAAAPSYSSVLEQTGGFYRFGTQDWRFSAGGVDIFRYTGAGSGAGAQLVDILSGTSLALAGAKVDLTGVAQPGFEHPFAGITAPTGWYMEFGQAVSRTTDAPLFNAITVATTGNTHNNTTIDNLPTDLRGLGLEGAFIEITGASLGTTIISINSATSMTVSASITGTATGAALRILPWGQGDGSTTFNVPNRRGVVLAGRDNMGGTAQGLLTLAQSQGILGTKLNATGGEQGHTTVLAEAPTGQFTFNFNDPGHLHNYNKAQSSGNQKPASSGSAPFDTNVSTTTDIQPTGITASITDHAGGGAHNNVQPTGITNYIIKR